MQERQVTVGRRRHALPDPFFVLATQNPIEQEGTYPLPGGAARPLHVQHLIDYPRPAKRRVSSGDHVGVLRPRSTRSSRRTTSCDCRSSCGAFRSAEDVVNATRCGWSRHAAAPERGRSDVHQGVGRVGRGPRATPVPRAGREDASRARRTLHAERPTTCVAVARAALRHRIVTNFNSRGGRRGGRRSSRTGWSAS